MRRPIVTLAVLGTIAVVVGIFMPATQRIRETPWGGLINHQKQIALASRNYSDAFNDILPPGTTTDSSGKLMHGWMTQLLPYVEYDILYRQIDFKLAWDQDANRPAFQERVRTYLNPYVYDEKDSTGLALSHFAGNQHVLTRNEGLKVKEITDGRSNTMLLAEVAVGYKPWGHPVNLRDPAAGFGKTPEQFGTPRPSETVFVAFLDGSVRQIKTSVSPNVLKAIATPAGGETVNDRDW